MSDQAKQATPKTELERQIMDPNVPKNEREWWAAAEIERLESCLHAQEAVQPLYDEIKRLRTERLAFATESEERRAENERLGRACNDRDELILDQHDEIERLQELLRDIGANRYWEGRWRDAKAENERLRAALTTIRADCLAYATQHTGAAQEGFIQIANDAMCGADVQTPPENELLPPKSATRIPVTVTPRGPGKMNPND